MNIPFEIIFLLGALMCGWGSVLSFLKSFHRLKNCETTTGTVTDWTVRNFDGTSHYYPKIQFLTRQGERIVFTASVGSSRKLFSEGATVPVIFDASNPQLADLKTFMSLWAPGVVLAFIALSMVAVVVAMATERS